MVTKKHLAMALATLGLVAAAGCVIIAPLLFTAEKDFDLNLSLDSITKMTITWRNGPVTYRVDDTATQITASGKQRVTASSQDNADAALDDFIITLAVDATDATLANLTFNAPTNTPEIFTADVEVTVPAGLDLTIDAQNGTIRVTGNAGPTAVTLDNGSVTVMEQVGDTTATVDNGAINIESQDGNVDAQLGNGPIEIQAQPGDDGSVDANTNVGNIDIQVPADFAAELSLQTDLGAVSADLTSFAATNVVTQARMITATLNGGGGTITAETDLGSINFEALP
jgi:DUF4097 and DUF4098 domain-containing protein YvlB